MRKKHDPLWLLGLICCLAALGCAGDGNADDVDLDPELTELTIAPNPADVNDEALFYAAWRDHDGDMENATVTLELENEEGDAFILPVFDLEIEGTATAGTLSFRVKILSGYQGNCLLTVTDEAGHTSEEVEEYLFVNEVSGAD